MQQVTKSTILLPALAGALLICAILQSGHPTMAQAGRPVLPRPTRTQNQEHICALPSMHRIQVPVYGDHANSPMWTLTFQHIQKSSSYPTVVFITGGPGAGATADFDNDVDAKIYLYMLGLPSKANYVFVDPRTAGCNGQRIPIEFPQDSLTTQNLANDTLEVLKALKLKNYFIYGHSYGSLEATVVASLLERTALHMPRALILSGIVGKANHGFENNYYHAMWESWNRLRRTLPEKVVKKISQDNPLGMPPQVWAPFIANGMAEGEQWQYYGNHKLQWEVREELLKLQSDDPAVEAEVKKAVLFQYPDPTGMSIALFKHMACNEIWNDMTSIDFVNGNFIPVPQRNFCKNVPMNNPYDSARWPITRMPIVYFQGLRDTQTPFPHTRYHVATHTAVHRVAILFPQWGHGLLGGTLEDCREYVWAALMGSWTHLPSALDKCKAEHRIFSLPPH